MDRLDLCVDQVWPGSHRTVWKAHQEAMRDRTQLDDYHDPQLDPPRLNHAIEEVRRTTAPVETHGPAGTVVLLRTFISLLLQGSYQHMLDMGCDSTK